MHTLVERLLLRLLQVGGMLHDGRCLLALADVFVVLGLRGEGG